ncbi:MAG: MBL fold metallo-hydrolase [Nannocystaceae bacterium]
MPRLPSLLLLLGLLTLLVRPTSAADLAREFTWIDVGQGSALLVRDADIAVMIDAGPPASAEAIIAALDRAGVTRVDLWILTHHDADHIGGLARALAGHDGRLGTDDDLEVDAFWDRGLEAAPSTGVFASYRAAVGDRRAGVGPGATWSKGQVEIAVVDTGPLAPDAPENHRGLALCVTLGRATLLAPGDLPAQRVAAAALACGPVDLFWVAHHGGRDGISAEVVTAIGAATAVISAGMDNPYCHPDPAVLARLGGRRVLITGAAGIDPEGACPPLAPALGPEHVVVGDSVVVPVDP